MMKLITFAHRGEAQAFFSAYSFTPVEFFFDGLLKSEDYYLLITGEGPQAASEKTICVLAALHNDISHVYNLGVAGSLNHKLKKYDLLWVRTAYAHHAERLEFKSYTSQNPKAFTDCLTAFNRVLNPIEKQKISHFADLVDRELWAISSAAHLFKKPFDALKIISDELNEEKDIENSDICQFIKAEAPVFSDKLMHEFNLSQRSIKKEIAAIPKHLFLGDTHFYFTISQERKLLSLLEGLKLKRFSIESLPNHPDILAIMELGKSPKERTKLLLQFLSDQLNPISVKIRNSLNHCLDPLHEANIQTGFDVDFEEDWLNLSMRIHSTRDLEKIKNALKIFSYQDYKRIFDGQFDV